jgi:UPF0755 protein
MKKTLYYMLTLVLLSLCGFIGMGWYALFTSVVDQDGGVVYFLKPGASKKAVIADMSQQGLIKISLFFSLYTYPQKNAHLKTGEYRFPRGSTAISIWQQVTTGRGLVYHPFAIIPGWSFTQLRRQLLHTPDLRHETAVLDEKQIMAHLGYPSLAPEGEFFPETYYYTKGISDWVILKRAFDLMQKKMKSAWQDRKPGLPYKDDYEALIAASLIEKEAYLNSERPVIAGVLINRLKKDMLLQFDPTVIYGLGSRYDGKIHKENLLEDTAYNTYVHKGLPPTPIAMPSMASIQAALHPEDNDYFYFVAKGDGSHQFSKTLPEHHEAVSTAINKQHVFYFNEGKIKKMLHTLMLPSSSLIRISDTL